MRCHAGATTAASVPIGATDAACAHARTEDRMDSERFDRLIRTIEGEASRRGVVRAGLGVLAAAAVAAVGLRAADDATAGNKHRAKRRKQARAQKKKKKVKIIPGPPGPQGPPGLAAPVQTCSGARPITCGGGCCQSTHPLCCDSTGDTSGKSCHPSGNGFQCCPLALGGGACGGAFPKCCPAFASS